MLQSAPTKLLPIFLASLLLTACGSTPKPSPTNFSGLVRESMAEQKAADCAVWKDEPLPAFIQERVDVAGAADEAGTATPDQQAILDWFNRDAARVTKRQTYCAT